MQTNASGKMADEKILLVDDDPHILDGYKRTLRKRFSIDTAQGAEAGLKAAAEDGPYAVIVSDMRMPGMDGIQFLSRVKETAPDTVRMMLTGFADQNTAIEAVNAGNIFRFLTKPCADEVFAKALEAGIAQYRLITAERELLEKTLNGSIRVLTEILSVTDPNLFGRAMKLRDLVQTLAKALNVPSSWDIESAAMLSQIGYAGIPPEVLVKAQKKNPLADNEREMLSRFPEIGRQLLANIPRLEPVSKIVLYQNKLFDGSGFPKDGAAGDKIPLGSRILKPLSDLIQLENEGVARAQAFHLLLGRKGWYDPEVLKKLVLCLVDEKEQGAAEGETLASLCLKELRSGYRLVSKIETADGTLLLSPGQRLSPMHMERLRNYAELMGIKEPIQVLIPDAAAHEEKD